MSYTPFTATDAADLSLAADFVVCRAALAEVVATYRDGTSYELPAAVERAGYLLARTEEKAADLGRDLDILVGCRDYLTALLTRDPGFLEPAQAGLRKLWTTCPPFSDELVAL